MIDLGYSYETSMPEKSDEPKMHYPEICVRGDKIPKLPEGEFYAVVKARVVGMRDPADGEKSVDIELVNMSGSVPEAGAMKLAEKSYKEDEDMEISDMFSEDKTKNALRATLSEIIKENAIGQSG
jgi:hypothetical protein